MFYAGKHVVEDVPVPCCVMNIVGYNCIKAKLLRKIDTLQGRDVYHLV